ncbi:MAG: uridine kinase family protein [Fusobacteriaceae bacterium]
MIFDERIYYTTLKIIFLKAVHDLFPKTEVEIQHTLSHGLFGVLKEKKHISEKEINKIKNRMDELIAKDYTINIISNNVEEIRRKAKNIQREDILRTINSTGWIYIKEYELEGYHDFFYEKTYPSTGFIYLYDLVSHDGGFILRFPIEDNSKVLPEYKNFDKLSKIQKESNGWEELMDVSYIGSLNEKTMNGTIRDLIRLNETLHEIKLADISEKIVKNKKIKLITIAGPSSSGKTTFGHRLSLYLKANKLSPTLISLDNYYIGRTSIPINEKGEKDFESLEALDLTLLNKNLADLILGKEVEIPQYNFITGEREKKGIKMQIPVNGIILLEGIHGLNEEVTKNILRENKFKIYISCLTQLNIDMHNRIPTNEVRKIRRIVRDSLSRGISAEHTLSMWKNVRDGEEKHIFKYQEEADTMFDTNLVYELGVLKRFAMKELVKIRYGTPNYEEAKRLLRFLYCFIDIDDKFVPETSILKEFIGGSYFYNY